MKQHKNKIKITKIQRKVLKALEGGEGPLLRVKRWWRSGEMACLCMSWRVVKMVTVVKLEALGLVENKGEWMYTSWARWYEITEKGRAVLKGVE